MPAPLAAAHELSAILPAPLTAAHEPSAPLAGVSGCGYGALLPAAELLPPRQSLSTPKVSISCPQTDHLKHENALENLNCLEVRTASKSPHHCLTVKCALCHIYFPRHSYNPCATKHIHNFYLTTNCTNYTNITQRHSYTFGQFVKFVFNFYHAKYWG